MNGPIVLFDGVCKFCNSSVNFIIDHDRQSKIRFTAQQSATGEQLLHHHGIDPEHLNSLVLIEGSRYFTRSTAALRIARYLDVPWCILAGFLLIPTFLRDPGYDLLARNRYRWFGKLDACRIPTPEIRSRFLD